MQQTKDDENLARVERAAPFVATRSPRRHAIATIEIASDQ
jgi:hypothetical protein